MKPVRTRFAPSPTGYMHIGNLRTALYAYLIAKKAKGSFILRIEDTDRSRQVEGADEVIFSTLKDAGLFWDEGPDVGGPYAPYTQSERKDAYLEGAKILIENGGAYYCFCSKDELDRRCAKEDGAARYDGHCRDLSDGDANDLLERGLPYVIRQKMPKEGVTVFSDLVYGDIAVDNSELEDQILIKSDGMPTYNFANVVDDHAMEISHVIRGNEYLSSAPKYTLLYRAFGWDIPAYIHCPQVMRDHQHKLSKRDGDASYQDFAEKGFLPEAIINYLALLGWSPKGEKEIFSLEELIEQFDVAGMAKSPAIFDIQKMKYINAEHIRALSKEQFMNSAMPFIKQAVSRDDIDFAVLSETLQPRCEFFADIPDKLGFIDALPEYGSFLFFNRKMKTSPDTSREVLTAALGVLENLGDFTKDGVHAALFALIERLGIKNGLLLWPLRAALSGLPSTPGGGVELAAILGKEETLARLKKALAVLRQ